MNSLLKIIKHNPLATFVLLTYLISWAVVFRTHGLILPWGPMIAALILVKLTSGRAGVASWWRQVTQRPAELRWYGLAVAIPIAITLITTLLNVLFGAHLSGSFDWRVSLSGLPLLLLVGGEWEEPGWTGYALPYLVKRFANKPYATLLATLLLACIRAFWHLPLMLYGHIYWSDILLTIGFQIVITWLFESTQHSVLAVMLLHLTNNMVSGQIAQQFFSGADWVRYYWLHACVWSLLALGMLVLARPVFGRRSTKLPAGAIQAGQPLN